MFPEDFSEFFKGLTFTINGQPFSGEIGRITGKDSEEKKVEEKGLLKVGTKVIVTRKGKEYDGVICCVDTDTVPYRVDFNGYALWFNKDQTKHDGTTFRVAEEKPTFKKGDKVRLKDKFYDEDDFKNDERYIRESIAKIKGQTWTIEDITNYDNQKRACSSEKDCMWSIPLSLLELVETPKEIEPKVGMWAEIIKEHWGKPVGSIVKIASVRGDNSIYYECAKTEHSRGTFFAHERYYKLLPNYKPLRKWTDVEIMEAKSIVAEILYEGEQRIASIGGGNFHDGDIVWAMVNGKIYKAKCCPTDEWNVWIGRMVATCKSAGRALPSWIRKDGTK